MASAPIKARGPWVTIDRTAVIAAVRLVFVLLFRYLPSIFRLLFFCTVFSAPMTGLARRVISTAPFRRRRRDGMKNSPAVSLFWTGEPLGWYRCRPHPQSPRGDVVAYSFAVARNRCVGRSVPCLVPGDPTGFLFILVFQVLEIESLSVDVGQDGASPKSTDRWKSSFSLSNETDSFIMGELSVFFLRAESQNAPLSRRSGPINWANRVWNVSAGQR